jgi:hypothetical protein
MRHEPQSSISDTTLPRLPAQRFGIQLPRARRQKPSKKDDLAREAVNCNAGLDGRLGLWLC